MTVNIQTNIIAFLYCIAVYIVGYLRNYYIQNEVPDDTLHEFWRKMSLCCFIQGLLSLAFIPLILQQRFPLGPVAILLTLIVIGDLHIYRSVREESARLDEQYESQETDD